MKRVLLPFMFSAALSSCAAELSSERVKLESLSFEVPAEWQRHDEVRPGMTIAEWQPVDNERKESVTVIRSTTSPAVAKAGIPALTRFLADAQKSLGAARSSRIDTFTTQSGLAGARIAVDFVPQQASVPYHRIHVVLVDGIGGLVHVIYTARVSDPRALEMVLESIRREEA